MDKVSTTCKLFESCYMVHTTYLTVFVFSFKKCCSEHKAELEKGRSKNVDRRHTDEFVSWFERKVSNIHLC